MRATQRCSADPNPESGSSWISLKDDVAIYRVVGILILIEHNLQLSCCTFGTCCYYCIVLNGGERNRKLLLFFFPLLQHHYDEWGTQIDRAYSLRVRHCTPKVIHRILSCEMMSAEGFACANLPGFVLQQVWKLCLIRQVLQVSTKTTYILTLFRWTSSISCAVKPPALHYLPTNIARIKVKCVHCASVHGHQNRITPHRLQNQIFNSFLL